MLKCIAIPQGLNGGRFARFWEIFFKELGFSVLLAPDCDSKMIKTACRLSDPELCLPAKLYIAECNLLSGSNADAIFSPFYESADRNIKLCPKMIAINDLARLSVPDMPELLQPVIELDIDEEMFSPGSIVRSNGILPLLSAPVQKPLEAYYRAVRLSQKEWAERAKSAAKGKTIALMGHSYVLRNNHLLAAIFRTMERNQTGWLTPDSLEWSACARCYEQASIQQPVQWQSGRKILGALRYLLDRSVPDGVIYIAAFGCALDAVIEEIAREFVQGANIPYLFLMLDEHIQPSHLLVRLEAFLDICTGINRN